MSGQFIKLQFELSVAFFSIFIALVVRKIGGTTFSGLLF